jgi:hypothetical protein
MGQSNWLAAKKIKSLLSPIMWEEKIIQIRQKY